MTTFLSESLSCVTFQTLSISAQLQLKYGVNVIEIFLLLFSSIKNADHVIGVARGLKGHAPKTFLPYLVVLCFER